MKDPVYIYRCIVGPKKKKGVTLGRKANATSIFLIPKKIFLLLSWRTQNLGGSGGKGYMSINDWFKPISPPHLFLTWLFRKLKFLIPMVYIALCSISQITYTYGVSKDQNSCLFRVKWSKTAWPEKWRHYNRFKSQELPAHKHSVTSQNTST